MSVIADIGHQKRPVAGAAAVIVERGMIVGVGTGSTLAYLQPLAAQGLDVRCPADFPGHGARDTASRQTASGAHLVP